MLEGSADGQVVPGRLNWPPCRGEPVLIELSGRELATRSGHRHCHQPQMRPKLHRGRWGGRDLRARLSGNLHMQDNVVGAGQRKPHRCVRSGDDAEDGASQHRRKRPDVKRVRIKRHATTPP